MRCRVKKGFPNGNPFQLVTFIFILVYSCSASTFGSCIPHRFLPTTTLIRRESFYLRTNRPDQYCILQQAHISGTMHIQFEKFQTSLRLQRPRYVCFLAPPLSFLYNSVVKLQYPPAFFIAISGILRSLLRIFPNCQPPIQKFCSAIPSMRP